MDQNKKELIDKLYQTANLVTESVKTSHQIENLKKEDKIANQSLVNSANARVGEIISTNEAKIVNRPRLPEACFVAPPKRPRVPDCDNEKKVMLTGVFGFLMYFAFIYLGAMMILVGTDPNFAVPYRIIPMFFIFIALMIPWLSTGAKRAEVLDYDKNCQAYEKSLQEWVNQLDEAVNEEVRKDLYNSFVEFDKSFLSFINETDVAIRDNYSAYNKRKQELQLEYIKKYNELVEHKKETDKELASIDVLSPSYYYLALDVADILKSGRADTLKEALNLAIDDVRKENEAEERRREAQRQEDILKRQAEEERRHNAAMERAAREQNDELRQQGDELRRQGNEMRKQYNKKYDTSMCHRCYNFGRGCNGSFVRQTGTCGSFRTLR